MDDAIKTPHARSLFRRRPLRFLPIRLLTLPLSGCIEFLGALVGGCMYVTDPLFVELGVPTHSNPIAYGKPTSGKRYVVTDLALLYLEQRRTNLPLEKGLD